MIKYNRRTDMSDDLAAPNSTCPKRQVTGHEQGLKQCTLRWQAGLNAVYFSMVGRCRLMSL